jgi:hypothetical protein
VILLQLPDDFKDFYGEHSADGKGSNKATMTHLNCELFHAQWKIIMNNEFKAYCHGIVIVCADGVHRRFYLQLFTYSADYPEK